MGTQKEKAKTHGNKNPLLSVLGLFSAEARYRQYRNLKQEFGPPELIIPYKEIDQLVERLRFSPISLGEDRVTDSHLLEELRQVVTSFLTLQWTNGVVMLDSANTLLDQLQKHIKWMEVFETDDTDEIPSPIHLPTFQRLIFDELNIYDQADLDDNSSEVEAERIQRWKNLLASHFKLVYR